MSLFLIFFSLEYHETLMAANGTKAEELLEHVLEEDFILAVEGGVAAIDTFFSYYRSTRREWL